jgi:transposase InsO family protein
VEIFQTLKQAKALAEYWRLEYNHRRPHSSLDYRTPAKFAARILTPSHKW